MGRNKSFLLNEVRVKDNPNFKQFRNTNLYASRFGDVYRSYKHFDKKLEGYKVKGSRFVYENKHKKIIVSRLIYEAFNGAIPNGYYVVHKNGEITNNSINNLKLVDMQQRNILSNVAKSKKRKLVYNVDTKKLYRNIDECGYDLGYAPTSIRKMCCKNYPASTSLNLIYVTEDEAMELQTA